MKCRIEFDSGRSGVTQTTGAMMHLLGGLLLAMHRAAVLDREECKGAQHLWGPVLDTDGEVIGEWSLRTNPQITLGTSCETDSLKNSPITQEYQEFVDAVVQGLAVSRELLNLPPKVGACVKKDAQFTCPKCGCHHFGTDGCAGPKEGMVGYCHGNECGFTWPRTDDHKYFSKI